MHSDDIVPYMLNLEYQPLLYTITYNYNPQMRNFEAVGLSRPQAEALTRHVTELLCAQKQRITATFVERDFVHRAMLETESR
jgi:hypothetical protein